MDIQFVAKTSGSTSVESCPAYYRVTSHEGGYVIQGKRVPPEVRAQAHNLGLDEELVWVPDDLAPREAG